MRRLLDHFLNLHHLLLEELLPDDDLDLDGAVPQDDLGDEGVDQLVVNRLLVADHATMDAGKKLFLRKEFFTPKILEAKA